MYVMLRFNKTAANLIILAGCLKEAVTDGWRCSLATSDYFDSWLVIDYCNNWLTSQMASWHARFSLRVLVFDMYSCFMQTFVSVLYTWTVICLGNFLYQLTSALALRPLILQLFIHKHSILTLDRVIQWSLLCCWRHPCMSIPNARITDQITTGLLSIGSIFVFHSVLQERSKFSLKLGVTCAAWDWCWLEMCLLSCVDPPAVRGHVTALRLLWRRFRRALLHPLPLY